jgi:hypothetical protein
VKPRTAYAQRLVSEAIRDVQAAMSISPPKTGAVEAWLLAFEQLVRKKVQAYSAATADIVKRAVASGIIARPGSGDGSRLARAPADEGDDDDNSDKGALLPAPDDDGISPLLVVAAPPMSVADQVLQQRSELIAAEIRAPPSSFAAEGGRGKRLTGAAKPRSYHGNGAISAVLNTMSDAGVQVMLMLKVTRLAVQVGALFVAQKVFSEAYVRAVYAEGGQPPELRGMLFMFLSVDATVQLVITLLVVLTSYLYKTDDNTFALDDDFVATMLGEYFVSTVVLLVFGLLFAALLKRKRYFHYPDQGGAVSSAYRDLMIGVCAVSCFVPYHALM